MCGIVGCVGVDDAVPTILEGLARLEYRGYDSAGLAVINPDMSIGVRKRVGKLESLVNYVEDYAPLSGSPGIGHTRWATHGEPSELNAHPHLNTSQTIAVVHNGIIENFQELRDDLEKDGVVFKSDTDTEVIPNLIDRELKRTGSFHTAFLETLRTLRGAYALGVLFLNEPNVIYAARQGSPLIIGLGQKQNFIASDVMAILAHVQKVIYLKEGEAARLSSDSIKIFNLQDQEVVPDVKNVTLQAESVDRAGFETFMLKEIHEQPRILRSLLKSHISYKGDVSVDMGSIPLDFLSKVSRIMIVSCGTSYYAGCYGKLLLDDLTSVSAEVDLASEFRYRPLKINSDTLIIAVSQSGETADTLGSIRIAKSKGCFIYSICNVPSSSISRESDAVFSTDAGPEIGVASTKAFTSQMMAFVILALYLGKLRKEIPNDLYRQLIQNLETVSDCIHRVLCQFDLIQAIADKHHDGPSALYLGRRYNYPVAMEGALKNKEISYQHAEGYAAGEMKHGPIALINEYLPVVCLCTQTRDELYEKMISNMKEVQARHGRIIAIATEGDRNVANIAEDIIYVPAITEELAPIVNVVSLQLLAYYAAHARGTDIDKPRNLAKSVTVE